MTYAKEPQFTDAKLCAVDPTIVNNMVRDMTHIEYTRWKLHAIREAKRNMMAGRSMREMYELQLIELFTARDKAETWLTKYLSQFDKDNK